MATSTPSGMLLSLRSRSAAARALWERVRGFADARVMAVAYALWAGAWTLASARSFYGYLLKQTGGEWSAPLDDVFIHFDYARATAEGHPFEWISGNGFSSGNTSLLYPFVLAAGYLGGYRDVRLMVWAAIVAAVSVFGTLLAARSIFLRTATGARAVPTIRGASFDASTPPRDLLAEVSSFALPPLFLGIGALSWSLWSGMEVALFLAVWALAWLAWDALDGAPDAEAPHRAAVLGGVGALLVLTRPEACTTVACFALTAVLPRARALGVRRSVALLAAASVPGALVLVGQAIANRVYTGEWSAAGAIVKLAVNNPYMTAQEKLDDYTFNLSYAILRNVEYHFADLTGVGAIVPALAAGALVMRRTRAVAVLLWSQILSWLLLVSLNGQVRWQNERYTMPAVAWLLVAAALGATALLRRKERPSLGALFVLGTITAELVFVALRPGGTAPSFRWPLLALGAGVLTAAVLRVHGVRAPLVLAALAVFAVHQAPKMRDQKWFFGRASRNIRDQHVRAGRFLAELKPRRVLVGDAGALLYASGRPGLDIIGLGGFHDLPFARAGVHGLAATIELLERVPDQERPDVMAIYPTWWGVLPTWFSSEVIARFPVEGNVICGGYEKVIYRADWHVLGTGEAPRTSLGGARVRDAIDLADLVSERAHAYAMPKPSAGWPDMKILPDPAAPAKDLFDGGRRIPAGRAETFTLRGLEPGRPATLVIRTAPEAAGRVTVSIAGHDVADVPYTEREGWEELVVPLDGAILSAEALPFTLRNTGASDFVDYHVWIAQ